MGNILKIRNKSGGWAHIPAIIGASAYEIAQEEGFVGTEQEWIDSLKGEKGNPGEKGKQGLQGDKGEKGEDGYTPIKGVDYYTDADKEELIAEVSGTVAERFFDSANAIKGTSSGGVVAIADVSPLEHDVKVKLTSDTITDFSDTAVRVFGKNLWDWEGAVKNNSAITYDAQNDRYVGTIGDFSQTITKRYFKEEEIGKEMTVSGIFTVEELIITSAASIAIYINIGGSETARVGYVKNDIRDSQIVFYQNIIPQSTEDYISVSYGTGHPCIASVKHLQLEIGGFSDYEPYIEPVEYTPDTDGMLRIKSIYPSMTIGAADGVTVTAEYNRDINKVIENLENAILALGGNV